MHRTTYYDAALRGLVTSFYRRDFELFGYCAQPPASTRMPRRSARGASLQQERTGGLHAAAARRTQLSMLSLTTAGPKIVEDDQWAERREAFRQRHCVLFKDFVDQRVLQRLRLWRAQASGEFRTREVVERNLAVTGERQLPQQTSGPDSCFSCSISRGSLPPSSNSPAPAKTFAAFSAGTTKQSPTASTTRTHSTATPTTTDFSG